MSVARPPMSGSSAWAQLRLPIGEVLSGYASQAALPWDLRAACRSFGASYESLMRNGPTRVVSEMQSLAPETHPSSFPSWSKTVHDPTKQTQAEVARRFGGA